MNCTVYYTLHHHTHQLVLGQGNVIQCTQHDQPKYCSDLACQGAKTMSRAGRGWQYLGGEDVPDYPAVPANTCQYLQYLPIPGNTWEGKMSQTILQYSATASTAQVHTDLPGQGTLQGHCSLQGHCKCRQRCCRDTAGAGRDTAGAGRDTAAGLGARQ